MKAECYRQLSPSLIRSEPGSALMVLYRDAPDRGIAFWKYRGINLTNSCTTESNTGTYSGTDSCERLSWSLESDRRRPLFPAHSDFAQSCEKKCEMIAVNLLTTVVVCVRWESVWTSVCTHVLHCLVTTHDTITPRRFSWNDWSVMETGWNILAYTTTCYVAWK